MDFGPGTYALSLAAGSLSTLSPCVLPLIPILLGSAVAAHRLGPFALAAGLALSYTAAGVLLAGIGASLDIDPILLRDGGAVLLIGFAMVLLSGRLQERFAGATSALSGAGNNLFSRLSLNGLPGQFLLGLLLGVVWSPCVGPTLGAAVTLASQGRDLARVGLVMLLFGLGAALPLVLVGALSRQALARGRGRLLAAGRLGRQVMGGVLLLVGVLILTGADKAFEAWLLNTLPDWLVSLTTAY